MYRQHDKKLMWSAALDIKRGASRPVLNWYDTGELAVEWRDVGSYERVIVDGKTGKIQRRAALDPKIVAAIMDPVKFILEQPWTAPTDVVDESKLTTAQRFMRLPGNALGSVCAVGRRETRSIRIVEMEEGMLLIAEGTHGDGGDGYAQRDPDFNRHARLGEPDAGPPAPPPHPLAAGASCCAVTLMDATKVQLRGRWSTGRADRDASAPGR